MNNRNSLNTDELINSLLSNNRNAISDIEEKAKEIYSRGTPPKLMEPHIPQAWLEAVVYVLLQNNFGVYPLSEEELKQRNFLLTQPGSPVILAFKKRK